MYCQLFTTTTTSKFKVVCMKTQLLPVFLRTLILLLCPFSFHGSLPRLQREYRQVLEILKHMLTNEVAYRLIVVVIGHIWNLDPLSHVTGPFSKVLESPVRDWPLEKIFGIFIPWPLPHSGSLSLDHWTSPFIARSNGQTGYFYLVPSIICNCI